MPPNPSNFEKNKKKTKRGEELNSPKSNLSTNQSISSAPTIFLTLKGEKLVNFPNIPLDQPKKNPYL